MTATHDKTVCVLYVYLNFEGEESIDSSFKPSANQYLLLGGKVCFFKMMLYYLFIMVTLESKKIVTKGVSCNGSSIPR